MVRRNTCYPSQARSRKRHFQNCLLTLPQLVIPFQDEQRRCLSTVWTGVWSLRRTWRHRHPSSIAEQLPICPQRLAKMTHKYQLIWNNDVACTSKAHPGAAHGFCSLTLLLTFFVTLLTACSSALTGGQVTDRVTNPARLASTTQVRRADIGQAIAAPQPWPVEQNEIRELCDFEAEQFKAPAAQISQRRDCQSRLSREMSSWRRSCHEQVSGAQFRGQGLPEKKTFIERCVRRDKNFAKDLQAARQYREFQTIKEPEGFERFIRSNEHSDTIGLVNEARARLATFCEVGVSLDTSATSAQAWFDRFSLVGPTHCLAQQAMARRVLRLNEFRQATGQRGKLDTFVVAHTNEDPDGLVPQARAQAQELLQKEERTAYEQARSWNDVEAFLGQYDPVKEPRAVLTAAARIRRDVLRDEAFANVRATPLDILERRYLNERGQMPQEWAPFVLNWLVEQSSTSGDVRGGLRVFRLSGDARAFEIAVSQMSAREDHDAVVEDAWGAQPNTADARRAFIAYQRKRNTADSWLRAFKLSNERSDLRVAGQKASTQMQKARVEHMLVNAIGLDRAFVTKGHLAADGKVADITQPSILFGLAKGIGTTVDSTLTWQVHPSPDLPPMQHGRYHATVKVTMTIASSTRTRALGTWTTSDAAKDLTATDTVLIQPSGRYSGSGSQKFQWSPTSHTSALFNLTESTTETTGLKVKVEVLKLDLLEP